jgi:tetratricopeptide (TPR) repeat protein
LYGRCDEELSLPYQPWVEAIGYLLEASDSEAVSTALELHGPELATLIPQLRRRFPDLAASTASDAETERYMLLQAVTGCLALLGAETPILLVLDDLHWADKQTLTMLRHVLTNMSAASLMVVVTYRDSDLGSGHPLTDTVAALRREPGVELLSVGGLDDLEMVQLVEISAGHQLDDDARNMALMLRQETAGNPFFAHEILRNLVEHGDLYVDEATGRWLIAKTFEELTLPQSVRDVVGQRIARLGEEPLKTLSTAAIIGREFDLDLLAAVMGADEDDLLDQLELATAAGILVEAPGAGERFRFPHTLARSTLAADLSEGRRRRIHRKVAESLEATVGSAPGGRAGELATHWLAAAVSVDGAKATHYARLAGQHAQAALAPDEAIRWFTVALENLELADAPDENERARLLVDLGMAQKDASEPAYRQTLLDAGTLAARLGDSSLMATAAIANSRGFTSKLGVADTDRIDALERALTAIGEGATAARAMLLATLISELEYHSTFEDRIARYDEAIRIAREVGDPATLVFVLNRLCVSLAVPQTLALRHDACAEALALADDLGDVTLRFWSQCGAYIFAVGSGDPNAADTQLQRLADTADASGRASLRWIAGYLRGSLLSLRGDTEVMELAGGENFALAIDSGEPDALDYFGAALMTTRWYQGRIFELIEQVDQAVADNPSISTYRAIPAYSYAEAGDFDRANELLAAMVADGFETVMVNNLWSTTLSLWSMTVARLGNSDVAAVLYELLSPSSGQIAHNRSLTPFAIDSALAQLATVLGDYEQAHRHFDIAHSLLEPFGANYAIVTDLLGRARLHVAVGGDDDRSQAIDLAARAMALAQQHGYAAVERLATELQASLSGS